MMKTDKMNEVTTKANFNFQHLGTPYNEEGGGFQISRNTRGSEREKLLFYNPVSNLR